MPCCPMTSVGWWIADKLAFHPVCPHHFDKRGQTGLKRLIARILHGFIVLSMWLAGAYLVFFVALLFI